MNEFSTQVALVQWDEGLRRLKTVPFEQQPATERVVELAIADLHRRLGSSFTVVELVDLYYKGTDWCLELAVVSEPDMAYELDISAVCDAAFARYVREASDYAGGRVIEPLG